MPTRSSRVVQLAALLIALAGCRGETQSTVQVPEGGDGSIEAQIGPIAELELDPYNPDLAERGGEHFRRRCTACHQLDREVVGPPLAGILEVRSPVYVMNMIMNPTGMLERHPVAQALLKAYVVPMMDLGVSEEDARALVEFLRRAEADFP